MVSAAATPGRYSRSVTWSPASGGSTQRTKTLSSSRSREVVCTVCPSATNRTGKAIAMGMPLLCHSGGMEWMIYGASGYTGQLIAELSRSKGHAPILAGRSAEKVRPLATRLGLRWRAFALDQPDLAGVSLVLHCAGPFSQTSRQMVDACLAARAHYLDVTGEVEVFEAGLARGPGAKERRVGLLPRTGFDVVPADCLAAPLHPHLPHPTPLALAL